MDSFTVLRTLRAENNSTSAIVITARDSVEDIVRRLDLGAHDLGRCPFRAGSGARCEHRSRNPSPPGMSGLGLCEQNPGEFYRLADASVMEDVSLAASCS
jgi:hypothetical protein